MKDAMQRRMRVEPKTPSLDLWKSEELERPRSELPGSNPPQRWSSVFERWLGARIEDDGYVLA